MSQIPCYASFLWPNKHLQHVTSIRRYIYVYEFYDSLQTNNTLGSCFSATVFTMELQGQYHHSYHGYLHLFIFVHPVNAYGQTKLFIWMQVDMHLGMYQFTVSDSFEPLTTQTSRKKFMKAGAYTFRMSHFLHSCRSNHDGHWNLKPQHSCCHVDLAYINENAWSKPIFIKKKASLQKSSKQKMEGINQKQNQIHQKKLSRYKI